MPVIARRQASAEWGSACGTARYGFGDTGWIRGGWCPEPESNQRHCDFQSHALPTELSGPRRRRSNARERYLAKRPRPVQPAFGRPGRQSCKPGARAPSARDRRAFLSRSPAWPCAIPRPPGFPQWRESRSPRRRAGRVPAPHPRSVSPKPSRRGVPSGWWR